MESKLCKYIGKDYDDEYDKDTIYRFEHDEKYNVTIFEKNEDVGYCSDTWFKENFKKVIKEE